LSTDLTTSGLLGEFCDIVDQRFRVDDSGRPFHEWVRNIILDGRPFTYGLHEYLIEPYKDDHPHQVEMKAAQLGLTSNPVFVSLQI